LTNDELVAGSWPPRRAPDFPTLSEARADGPGFRHLVRLGARWLNMEDYARPCITACIGNALISAPTGRPCARKSSRPNVLALGLVDDRGPDAQPDYTRHLVVTLYILGGHHKIAAAAQAALAMQFLILLPHTSLGRASRGLVDRGVTFSQGIAVGP